MKRFEGIYTVMMTVYDDAGGIDRDGMAALTRYQVQAGVHGLVVLGSNGECPYLTRELQQDAVDAVVEACAGAVPVIVGVNERGTDSAIAAARFAEQAGAEGLLVALPVFYPLTEADVIAHYDAVSCAVDLPVLYYNFPTHTHLPLAPGPIAGLEQRGLVVGAKETIFDVAEVRALVDATSDDFCAFTGTTLNLSDMMAVGACGAICPLPNVVPDKAVALYEALSEGDAERAAALQGQLFEVGPLLAGSPTPHAMMKEALRLLGHPVSNQVKPPLPPLTEQQAELVRSTLYGAGLLDR